MYKTVTVWIQSEGKRMEFQSSAKSHGLWLRVDNVIVGGDASFHFDADGLRQFIEALEGLERDMIEVKKEEVKVKNG